jgi:AraC-like DNA-binding protein
MDVLADILEITRLTGRVFCHASAAAPWGLSVEPAAKASFHFVIDGSCWLLAGKAAPRRLGAGDLVLLPRGAGHSLCDDPASPRIPLDQWRAQKGRPSTRRGAAVTDLLCGTYELETESNHPVLRLLPAVIHIPAHDSVGLQTTLQLLLAEFERPDVGSSKVVSRLLDVLFIQTLRFWIDRQQEGSSGWLGALRDPAIGRALSALHRAPARPWTVKSLAGAAGLSRPVFARRFKELVGATPLAYLTQVRLDTAARLLRTTDDSLSSIAQSVGYTSEFAFNRAFRRTRGTPPGRFRGTRSPSRSQAIPAK